MRRKEAPARDKIERRRKLRDRFRECEMDQSPVCRGRDLTLAALSMA